MVPYWHLAIGILLAAIGGELFLRGSVGLARWLGIAPLVIGITVAAFGTSAPELSVGIASALKGVPQISFGDVIGSNVANIALILGMALCISGIQCPPESVRRDFRLALLVPVLTALLCLDGKLSRTDGLLLILVFCGWLIALVNTVLRQRGQKNKDAQEHPLGRRWLALALVAVGLAMLFGAGYFVVAGARGVALSLGVPEFVIGALMVAVGTSTPEIAVTLIAKWRGHDDVSLGTILGSNIFNSLLIVGIVAVVCPFSVTPPKNVFMALAFGLLAVALVHPPRSGFIPRRRGVYLLVLYLVYVVALCE